MSRMVLFTVVVLYVSSVSCFSSWRSFSARKGSRVLYISHQGDRRNRMIGRARRFSNTEVSMRKDPKVPGKTTVGDNETAGQMQAMKRDTLSLLREGDFDEALLRIKNMVSVVGKVKQAGDASGAHVGMSAVVDETIQSYTGLAFAQPFRGGSARERISHGLGAIQLQLSSSAVLAPPFSTLPRATFVSALKALTGLITNDAGHEVLPGRSFKPIDAAFRILQRLVTGNGVRHKAPDRSLQVSERDFNMVLNAVSHVGRMDLAHKIVALQERTAHAPILSPVSYSILLKGYGRLHDLENVQMILSHAGRNGIEPDTVMLNSVIDAFVNCDNLETAQDIFCCMKDPDYEGHELSKYSPLLLSRTRPSPNRRTYNTILKGLARKGRIAEAVQLTREMKAKLLWDNVTTNTLVSAAVKALDFDLAERILANHTAVVQSGNERRKHPNVEAYTELLDGYAKALELDKALGILQLMSQRGVEPNEYTYTCIIGGLARAKKLDKANKMLQFMESKQIKPRVVTYNALISGLLEPVQPNSTPGEETMSEFSRESEGFTHYASEAINLLRRMVNVGIRPNAVTISVLVGGLGRCDPPRLAEAKAIVEKLRNGGIIAVDDQKVATAMIRVCGLGNDLKGAIENFRTIKNPDGVAVNAFLDACCRCGHVKLAFDTFEHFFGKNSTRNAVPDVITYSILMSALLTEGTLTPVTMERTRVLYREMRGKRGIMPDKALVDM